MTIKIRKCQAGCGHKILLHKPESFEVINHRKVCYSCASKHRERIKGATSYYRTPINAARFNFWCGLLRQFKSAVQKRVENLALIRKLTGSDFGGSVCIR
jgi:hypothetical protein